MKQPLLPKTLIADRVILRWPIARGVNSLSLDELTYGPVIAPENLEGAAVTSITTRTRPIRRRCSSGWIAWRWKAGRSSRGSCRITANR